MRLGSYNLSCCLLWWTSGIQCCCQDIGYYIYIPCPSKGIRNKRIAAQNGIWWLVNQEFHFHYQTWRTLLHQLWRQYERWVFAKHGFNGEKGKHGPKNGINLLIQAYIYAWHVPVKGKSFASLAFHWCIKTAKHIFPLLASQFSVHDPNLI